MDSFEWRRILSKKLESLPPSRQASQECAKLILRNEEFIEDLHSVILETLDTVDLNLRINIFQVIEELLEICTLENRNSYKNTILNDLTLILSKLLPKNPFVKIIADDDNDVPEDLKNSISGFKGLTNLYSSYLIMCEIFKDSPDLDTFKSTYNSNLLTPEDLANLDLSVPFNEDPIYDGIGEKKYESIEEAVSKAWDFLLSKKRQSQYERHLIEKSAYVDTMTNTKKEEKEEAVAEEHKAKENEENEEIEEIEEIEEVEEVENEDNDNDKDQDFNDKTMDDLGPEIVDLTTPPDEIPSKLSSPEKDKSVKPIEETPTPTPTSVNNQSIPNSNSNNNNNSNNNTKTSSTSHMINKSQRQLILSHRRMLLRIEADRERQKKSKENLWTVNRKQQSQQRLMSFERDEFEDIFSKFDEFDSYEDGQINDDMNKLLCVSLNDFKKRSTPIIKINKTPIGNKNINNNPKGNNHHNQNHNINHSYRGNNGHYGNKRHKPQF